MKNCYVINSNITARVKTITDAHTEITKELGGEFKCDLNRFKELWTLVTSRTFHLKQGDTTNIWFVPIADMINHADDGNTVYGYDEASKCFFVDAATDILANQELTMIYGSKGLTNNLWFMNYGFLNIASEEKGQILFGADAKEHCGGDKETKLMILPP